MVMLDTPARKRIGTFKDRGHIHSNLFSLWYRLRYCFNFIDETDETIKGGVLRKLPLGDIISTSYSCTVTDEIIGHKETTLILEWRTQCSASLVGPFIARGLPDGPLRVPRVNTKKGKHTNRLKTTLHA